MDGSPTTQIPSALNSDFKIIHCQIQWYTLYTSPYIIYCIAVTYILALLFYEKHVYALQNPCVLTLTVAMDSSYMISFLVFNGNILPYSALPSKSRWMILHWAFRGHARSNLMVPLDWPYMTSY